MPACRAHGLYGEAAVAGSPGAGSINEHCNNMGLLASLWGMKWL